MNNLLLNQHINRRKKSEIKTLSFNTDLRLVTNKTGPVAHRKRIRPNFITDTEKDTRKNVKERKPFSFSLPLLPLVCLFILLAGIILVTEHINSTPGGWMNRNVVDINPPENGIVDYNMALYTGIIPQSNISAEEGAVTLDAINQNEVDSIPLDLTETFAWKSYTVKRGDSVSKIAVDHALSMDAIIASNNITNARLLREGEVLRLPNMDGIPYTVRRGDSLLQISKTMNVPLEAILDANNINSDHIIAGEIIFIPGARMKREDLKLALGELMVYPIKGARLTSPFGWRTDPIDGVRRHHAAIDLAAPTGTSIVAAMDGEVTDTGYNRNMGNYIVLRHSDGFQTMYAHLNTTSVKIKDRVRQGAQIGTVGSTGRSTGPHLHFMVYKNGRAVNPLDFLAN